MNMVEVLAIKCAEGTTMLKLKLNLFRAKIKKNCYPGALPK